MDSFAGLCGEMLVQWCQGAEQYLYVLPMEDMAVYGTGYNSWGVQTVQKALAAFAVTGTATENETLIRRALQMLRFNLQSHLTGDRACLDGTKWGHTWISALGISRMMHGVILLWDRMSEEDKLLFQKMMYSESDYLLTEYVIKAGKTAHSRMNMPESNLWNGAQLLTTAAMFAKGDKRTLYMDKAADFFVNGISVDADQENQTVFLGKTVAQRHVGSNFFNTYALNHHGYMNVGYMVICLSQIAMIRYLLKSQGKPVPEFVTHHAEDLWNLVRHFLFPDGRLNRIGGDTRVRYCYCQDYLVPVLLMICDMKKDPVAKKLLKEWVLQVKKEFDQNGDRCFLSDRGKDLKTMSLLYYTRLESDRAVALSMVLQQASMLDSIEDIPCVPKDVFRWHDPFHGSTLIKGEQNFASFTWVSGERPQGMFLPLDASDMAEWKENCCGEIIGLGLRNLREVISHQTRLFENGFVTYGCSMVISKDLPEGSPPKEEVAKVYNFFAALPDGVTCVMVQLAVSSHRKYVKSVKGGLLKIPNDLFNDNIRVCETANKRFTLKRENRSEDTIFNTGSPFVSIDGKVSFVSMNENVKIFRPAKRQVGIHDSMYSNGFLYCEEFCTRLDREVKDYKDGEIILDDGAIVLSGVNKDQTEKYWNKCKPIYETIGKPEDLVRKITVFDTNKRKYVFMLTSKQAFIELCSNEADCFSLTLESE
ncbi:MAG TPA: hypothetical protein DDZ89_13390 [Clostridiales bacterium]|nr:hypothetical protein [Clostridiales bacterium]